VYRTVTLCFFVAALFFAGCAKPKLVLPGDTDYTVRSLNIEGAEHVALGELDTKLGVRVGNLLIPGQPYNRFRLVDDQRRVVAWWENAGYFDVQVPDPVVVIDDQAKAVDITWTVVEGEPSLVASSDLKQSPPELEGELRALIPFSVGDPIDLEVYRRVRHAMAQVLRDEGYAHATVYSRAFINRKTHEVHWVYMVDEGPLTTVGTLQVVGADNIPEDMIRARSGLQVGSPLSDVDKRKAEIDLLDSGAFSIVFVETDADVEDLILPLPPDNGGVLTPDRIDARGEMIPRALNGGLNTTLHVVDAPAAQTRVGANGQADLARIDAQATADLTVRNLFGPFHHLVVEGMAGYGWLWRSTTDEPLGLYGSALVRYVQPSFIARLIDLRLTARFEDRLFPDFHIREYGGGPGFRSTLTEDIFFDFDALYLFGTLSDYGPFSADTLNALTLYGSDQFQGLELSTSLILDGRFPDGLEAIDGQSLILRAAYAPGGAVGDARYLKLSADARIFRPITDALFVGLRAFGGWLVAEGEEGVPPSVRFFDGGAFGNRGAGVQQLASTAGSCDASGVCRGFAVGGMSSGLGSLELRWLPYRKPFGAVVFADAGGVGDGSNPFEQGVSLTAGLGLRIRTWYVPVAVDFSYRILDDDRTDALDHFQFFFRIGESF